MTSFYVCHNMMCLSHVDRDSVTDSTRVPVVRLGLHRAARTTVVSLSTRSVAYD